MSLSNGHHFVRGVKKYRMECNFSCSIIGIAAWINRTAKINEFNLDIIKHEEPSYLIINDVQLSDIPFLENLLETAAGPLLMYFGISADYIYPACAAVLSSAIEKYITKNPETYARATITVPAAMEAAFSGNVYVGSFYIEDAFLTMRPINIHSPLRYNDFKSVRPIAEKIVESIPPEAKQSRLDSIVWIDNWFQRNVTYAQKRVTMTGNKEYECSVLDDDYEPRMPDIFLRHIGECEDIATSIAMLLHLLEIPYKEVQGQGHAWLLVELGGTNYIWDCTHNITRDELDMPVSNKAVKYSDTFTLIGEDTFLKKYPTVPISGYAVSRTMFPRKELYESRKRLEDMGVNFSYL